MMQAAGKPRDEMRVSASAVRPLGTLAIAPASRFCAQIQQRYRQQAIRPTSDLELRRSPASLTQHIYHPNYRTQIQLSPRLHLTVLQQTLPPNQGNSTMVPFSAQAEADRLMIQQRENRTVLTRQTEEIARRLRREETEARVQQLRQKTATASTELTDRLTQRQVRMESVTASSAPALQQSSGEPIAAVQPVAQTVRRSVVLPSPEAIAPPSAAPQFASSEFSAPSARSQTATAPQAYLDVNRLTEQVIQTIDRRLLAYRERLGRI